MKIRLWLKPVSSDGQYIQMDKGKYPKFLICVPDTNPPRDAWPCFLCKVDHNDASNQPCPPPSPRPLHYICPLLWTKTVWWSVSTPNKWWSPASHVKQQKGQLSPHPPYFFIMVSCYAISKKRENSTPHKLHIRVFWGITRPSSVTYIERTVQNKRFDMWRTYFLCQRLEWLCCTHLCTTHTWASWEIYIFVFQYCCTFIDITV